MKAIADFLVYAAVVLFIAAILLAQPFMEARTYNRVTGSNVTTWDAIWLDLRVQAEPSKTMK